MRRNKKVTKAKLAPFVAFLFHLNIEHQQKMNQQHRTQHHSLHRFNIELNKQWIAHGVSEETEKTVETGSKNKN